MAITKLFVEANADTKTTTAATIAADTALSDAIADIQTALGANKPDFAIIASKVSGVLDNFTPKTLEMSNSKVVDNNIVLQFAEAAFSPIQEKFGKYIEKKLQYMPRNANYSRTAFIPDASNSNTTVGTLTTIRRDVDNLWVAQQLEICDPVDQNMIMSRLDFETTRYTDILMGAAQDEFPFDSFSMMPIAIATTFANWCIQGRDFVSKSGAITHKDGLLELYAAQAALVDSTTPSVNDIDLSSSEPVHVIQYKQVNATDYEESRIEALAQLNQLFWKMQNPNKCFAYAAGLQQSANRDDLVAIASNETIEGMKAADVNYFKNLASVFNPDNLLQVPETTFDTTYYAGSASSTKQDAFAAQVSNIIGSTTEQLTVAGGDIFIYERELFQRFCNSPLTRDEDYYKNNKTVAHFMTWRPSFDLLADRAYCLFHAPILVNQYAFPVTEISIKPTVSTSK